MTPEQAWKILDDDSEAYGAAIEGDKNDRSDYVSDLFRPGNSAELYLAQQTLLGFVNSILKAGVQDGKSQDKAA